MKGNLNPCRLPYFKTLVCAVFAIVAFMLTPDMSAQQMAVRSFSPQPSDLTANTHGTMRKDQNGATAALLKIRTNIDNLTFDGGITGIVDTLYLPGEYRLYIPQKSRKIRIHHPAYGVVEYSYTSPIEAAKTYLLELDLEGKEISFETSVDDTDIMVDGRSIGASPQTVFLPYGLHKVLARNGNMVYKGNVEVKRDDQTRIFLQMEDDPDSWGQVHLTVDPPAYIFFNGQQVGYGTWDTALQAGTYTVETRAQEGAYNPVTATADPMQTLFAVNPGQELTVKATPPTPHFGYLNFNVKPSDVTVTVDGDTVSTIEPVRLGIGKYDVEFSKPGYVSKKNRYTVYRNFSNDISAKLKTTSYFPKYTGYLSAYGSIGLFGPGFGAAVGGTFNGFDVELQFYFLNGRHCNKSTDWGRFTKYRERYALGINFGYQFKLARTAALVPQIGIHYQEPAYKIIEIEDRTDYEQNHRLKELVLPVSIKGIYKVSHHMAFFIRPKFNIKIWQRKGRLLETSQQFDSPYKTGFQLDLGVTVNI